MRECQANFSEYRRIAMVRPYVDTFRCLEPCPLKTSPCLDSLEASCDKVFRVPDLVPKDFTPCQSNIGEVPTFPSLCFRVITCALPSRLDASSYLTSRTRARSTTTRRILRPAKRSHWSHIHFFLQKSTGMRESRRPRLSPPTPAPIIRPSVTKTQGCAERENICHH